MRESEENSLSPGEHRKPAIVVRPALRFGLLLVAPGLLLLLPRLALSNSLQARLLWGGPTVALLAVPLLTRLMEIRLDQEGVAVRFRGRTSRIPWTELTSASLTAGSMGRSRSTSLLVLEGNKGQRMEMPLLLVRVSDRQRLMYALEQRMAPGTLKGEP
ncbi:hypothetical protein OG426_47905 [Streptomyces canus]|uniref:hypothetical protein n=1 Tax=Streptomyces canus TaxID=58343 RepID=UPI00386EE0C7|nr:hypothetical protein OG426_47905 [Streptomyces canus]